MSIFKNILGKIFPGRQPAPQPSQPAPTASAPATPAPTAAAPASAPAAPQTTAPAGASVAAAPVAPAEPVDVEAVLNAMAAKNPQKLNWRSSIVDLMKLLDLDSSLGSRKELAKELGYTGNMDDSATMNVWLHKQVMRKLAENGGKVPADLRD